MLLEKVKSLQQKASQLRVEGKYVETIELCHLLLEMSEEAKDISAMMNAHIMNAAAYYCIGDMDNALKSIEAHHALCLLHGTEAEWLNEYNVRVLIHSYNKDYNLAKETLEKIINLGKKLKHYNIVSNGYSNYSHSYQELGQYEKASEMALLGVEFAKLHQPFTPILVLRASLNVWSVNIKLGKSEGAKQFIDNMLAETFIKDFPREKAQLFVLLARWYVAQQEYQEAFNAYTAANDIVNQYKDLSFLREIQQERLKVVDLLEDFSEGVLIQKEYIDILHELEKKKLVEKTMQLEATLKLSASEKKANIDYLTGLFNRSYLENTTDGWLIEAQKNNEQIVCIAFDVDNLKKINDTYGHLTGDDVIVGVANACQQIIRKHDLLGRFGGDEFVLIMKGVTLADGLKKAQKLSKVINNLQFDTDTEKLSVTASIGVAHNHQQNIRTFKDLFHCADLALYQAKENGKNQVAHY